MLKDGEKGVVLQRDRETYAIVPHIPLGIVTSDLLTRLSEIADRYRVTAMKITSADRVALVGVREEDVDRIWSDLGMDPGAAVGACIRSIKACPGTTFAGLGNRIPWGSVLSWINGIMGSNCRLSSR